MTCWAPASCIIPAGFFDVRIDGTIDVSGTTVDGEGDQADPLGDDPSLCRRYPDVCCLDGPYHWRSHKNTEVAVLTATARGYHDPGSAGR
jgi:hypothetical protein